MYSMPGVNHYLYGLSTAGDETAASPFEFDTYTGEGEIRDYPRDVESHNYRNKSGGIVRRHLHKETMEERVVIFAAGNALLANGHDPRRHQESIIDVEKIEAGVEREPP